MRAQFQFACDPPVAIVRIAGDFDLHAADEFEDVLESLKSIGCRRVELDVGALTFVEPSVLDLLRHEQVRLRTSGGDLRVVAASRSFEEVCVEAEADTLLAEPDGPDGPPRLTALPAAHRRGFRA
jgi:anti-anti-sigma factor